MTETELERIAPEDLKWAVERALWGYEPARSSEPPLRVEVDQLGGVRITGWVRSRVIKEIVGRIAGSVPGVHGVALDVVADPDLDVALAAAMAASPSAKQLEPGTVRVRCQLGVARVLGKVPDLKTKAAVLDSVRHAPGVRGVEDLLLTT